MEVTIPDIERYLGEVKAAIRAGRCRFEMNSKRQENNALFFDYVISHRRIFRKCCTTNIKITDMSFSMYSERMSSCSRGLEAGAKPCHYI